MVQIAFFVRSVGLSKNKKKKKVNTLRNRIFHLYGEKTPLNRLL
jgi:hypothetical protein